MTIPCMDEETKKGTEREREREGGGDGSGKDTYSIGSSEEIHVKTNCPSGRLVLHDEGHDNGLKSSHKAYQRCEGQLSRVPLQCKCLGWEEYLIVRFSSGNYDS